MGTGSLEAVASEAKCVALREGFRWLASTSGVNFSWEASSVSSQQLTLARKAEKKYIREEPRQLYAFISPQCNAASRHTMLLQSELRPFRSCDGARYAALLLLGRRRRKKKHSRTDLTLPRLTSADENRRFSRAEMTAKKFKRFIAAGVISPFLFSTYFSYTNYMKQQTLRTKHVRLSQNTGAFFIA